MEIELIQISKRFHLDWIFKNVNNTFEAKGNYAIQGANGSGKSTLLKIISGHLSPSKGEIQHKLSGTTIPSENVFKFMSIAAPYVDLIEEFTLDEAIHFHEKFKSFQTGLSKDKLVDILQLGKVKSKYISDYSSGMKQRVKLIFAICSEVPCILLDEPGSNLDQQGKDWYKEILEKFAKDRTVIIASNEEDDFVACETVLNIQDFKD